MILSHPLNQHKIRVGPFPPIHPIWTIGFFNRSGAVIINSAGEPSEPIFWAWYPRFSWHAAQAIYRAFLREFEE